jgi:hypothetical protein
MALPQIPAYPEAIGSDPSLRGVGRGEGGGNFQLRKVITNQTRLSLSWITQLPKWTSLRPTPSYLPPGWLALVVR